MRARSAAASAAASASASARCAANQARTAASTSSTPAYGASATASRASRMRVHASRCAGQLRHWWSSEQKKEVLQSVQRFQRPASTAPQCAHDLGATAGWDEGGCASGREGAPQPPAHVAWSAIVCECGGSGQDVAAGDAAPRGRGGSTRESR